MYRKSALKLCGWNGNGKHVLTVKFCISTASKRGGRTRLSMATIGLVIREDIMGTFIAIFSAILLIFVALSMANVADKKLNSAIETTEKMEERLDAMEMRVNTILEKFEVSE